MRVEVSVIEIACESIEIVVVVVRRVHVNGKHWNPYFISGAFWCIVALSPWSLRLLLLPEITGQKQDLDVHVIIIDYESSDIDIEAVLKRSSIQRYTVVRIPGEEKFQRALALQRGASAVTDPHSILFLCDLHLKIPSKLISTIRKVRVSKYAKSLGIFLENWIKVVMSVWVTWHVMTSHHMIVKWHNNIAFEVLANPDPRLRILTVKISTKV